MKYVAFRIDNSTIKNHSVVSGWFVRGQSNTDYNWTLLFEANSYEDAVEYIRAIRLDDQPVYNLGGYGINI